MDVPVVERREHPWLGGVEVGALDSVRPGRQPALDIQAERLQETDTYDKGAESRRRICPTIVMSGGGQVVVLAGVLTAFSGAEETF